MSDSTHDAAPSDGLAAEEVASPASPSDGVAPEQTGYTPDGIPTFDYARERIETRYGTALGASELAAETPEGRNAEERYDARQRAAAEKLEQIRASMRDDSGNA